MIEIFCLGILLGTSPFVVYLVKKKIDESSQKFEKAHSDMKVATEKLKQLHENALQNYELQSKKIEKLQTEMNILKTSNSIKRPGLV